MYSRIFRVYTICLTPDHSQTRNSAKFSERLQRTPATPRSTRSPALVALRTPRSLNRPYKQNQGARARGGGLFRHYTAYCASAYWKITNLKIEIEKCIVSMICVLLRYAVHMPKEERLRTRYHKVTAYRS
jgi:hypothetical protein